jgi:hypothetical protein
MFAYPRSTMNLRPKGLHEVWYCTRSTLLILHVACDLYSVLTVHARDWCKMQDSMTLRKGRVCQSVRHSRFKRLSRVHVINQSVRPGSKICSGCTGRSPHIDLTIRNIGTNTILLLLLLLRYTTMRITDSSPRSPSVSFATRCQLR